MAELHQLRAAAKARTPRAARLPPRANGPSVEQPPALQPVPADRRPRPAARSAKPGNEKYVAGKTVIGNSPQVSGRRPRSSVKAKNEPPARARHAPEREEGPLQAGGPATPLIAIIFILIFTIGPYLAFTNHVPFTSYGYEVKATFANSANIALNSPVRIAGVDVGKVISAERDGDATKVTFTVDDAGRPIHDDAFATIRPRIFLEGNFFIDLDPGSPSAPELDSGGTIPVSHTSTAVQIDEVLTALQSPVRADLGRLLGELRHRAHPQADRGRRRDPAAARCKGLTGAEALNDVFKYGGDAGRYSAQVTDALTGTEADDLARLVAGAGRTFGPSPATSADLQGLIDNFNVFTGALATQSANLSTTIHLAGADAEGRPHLAGQPQPLAAAAADLRDRARAGGGRAAGPDRRLETVARPGPPAALRQRGRRRRQAAGRIDPGPGRRRAGGQGDRPAADQPAQPLHDAGAGADRQPDDQRPVQHRRPQLPRVLLHARELRRRGPELRRQRALREGSGRRRPEPRRANPTRKATRTRSPTGTSMPRRSATRSGTQPAARGQPPFKPDVRCDTNPVPDLNGGLGQVGPAMPSTAGAVE